MSSDKKWWDKTLTSAQNDFVDAYLSNGGNATRAYMELHPGASRATAMTAGSRFMANPTVRNAIDRRSKLSINRNRQEKIVHQLEDIAFHTPDIKPAERLKAIELLMKAEGMAKPARSRKIQTLMDLADDELEAIAKSRMIGDFDIDDEPGETEEEVA